MTPGDLDSGERLLTADDCADLRGIKVASWHRQVRRGDRPPPDGWVGRTPVWLASTVAD